MASKLVWPKDSKLIAALGDNQDAIDELDDLVVSYRRAIELRDRKIAENERRDPDPPRAP